MDELEKLRKQIDQIDKEMYALFIQRLNVAKQISIYKKEHNLEIMDIRREKKLLTRFHIQNEYLFYYQKFLNEIVNISKEYQKSIINKGE